MTSDLIIIALMLIINAIFAAYEMAIASISRARLIALTNLKHKKAAEALFMKERMEASLAVVQVGITFAGALAAATGGAGISDWLEPHLINALGLGQFWAELFSVLLLVIPLSIMTIIFAELIPKMLALNHRETICLQLSPAMKTIFIAFYPLISILEKTVKKILSIIDRKIDLSSKHMDQTGIHELNAAIALTRASRLISAGEEKILLSAAQLSRKTIKSIMTPLEDISMMQDNSSLSEALIKAHQDMHTRFPVYVNSSDEKMKILGYVNFKDIVIALKLNPTNPSIHGIIRPLQSFDEDMIVSTVLERMIKDKAHLALVIDKNGDPQGMITLEDIVEELLGDIEDEYDRQSVYIHPYNAGWIMGGGVPMNIVAQTTGLAEKRKDLVDSTMRLSDWCAQKIKKIKGGETIQDGTLRVSIRKLRRHKVAEAMIFVE
ncbi:MAG: hemolysin family protein [Candidatus Omnitrophica bacterium]|nr:hemolysin family protein [Candidatus Omnitrophota bacterium]